MLTGDIPPNQTIHIRNRRSRKKGSELRSCPGVDRISQLPNYIIDNILVRLPIEDAARTAVLSRKWNDAWFSISELKFDESFAAKSKKVSYPNSIMAIYGILMLHLGPIFKFKLSLTHPKRSSEIDRMFHCLSKRSVQELDFSIFPKAARYKLPSHFYLCLQLRSLKISYCTMNPPCNFIGFRNLSHLELYKLDLTSSVFENFISKCPLLEELNIVHCNNFIDSSVIKIDASKLKRSQLVSVGLCFRFIYVPLLKSLTYYESISDEWYDRDTDYGVEKSTLEEFCNAMPSLESLTVDCFFLQIHVVLNMSSTYGRRLKQLPSLKFLVATNVHLWNIDELTSLLGLLGSSPNLDMLHIEMDFEDYTADFAHNTAGKGNPFLSLEPNHLDFSCTKLQFVAMTYIAGYDSEIDLVKLLLLKSPGLKTMRIGVDYHVKPDTHMKIMTKVTRFRRASAEAEIDIFRD